MRGSKPYNSKKSKFNKPFKDALKPIKDNVEFPMEGGNKIWSANLPNKKKKKELKFKKAEWGY